MSGILSFGLNIIADILYPKYCFGCQRSGSYLCKFCMGQVPKLAQTVCVVCRQPSLQGFTHSSCQANLTNTAPDRLLSAFPYQYQTISDMIVTGKYYFIPEVFAVLGAMTADTIFTLPISSQPNEIFHDFWVCSIPLHPTKLRWRGFNQSEIAARVIAHGLHLPYAPLLTRIKNTKTQKDLDAQARKQNMQNAFACPGKAPTKVILVDDVCTTGQTFLDATRALKQAGSTEVWCVSIAKD